MDVADDVRARQAQQLVVAFDVFVKVIEPCTTVLGFPQLEALDHGAHGTVKHHDAVLQNVGQRLAAGVGEGLHGGYCRNPRARSQRVERCLLLATNTGYFLVFGRTIQRNVS